MGSWGVAIFSDDLASDVRDSWREALADGMTSEVATSHVLEEHIDSSTDPVLWLALAAAQTETGRLQDDIKTKALGIITDGTDLSTWEAEDTKLAQRRRVVLERLAEKLRGPQPKPKSPRKPKAETFGPDLAAGDILVAPSRRGFGTLFHVAAWDATLGIAYVETLLWERDDRPSRCEAAHAPLLPNPKDDTPIFPDAIDPRFYWMVWTRSDGQAWDSAGCTLLERDVNRPRMATRDGDWMQGTTWPGLIEWSDSDEFRGLVESTVT